MAQTAELTINDLGELNDDLFGGEVAAPEDYPDPVGPRPLDEGTYTARIVKLAKDADEAGNWRDPAFPTIQADFEITEGDKNGRKANFIRISSRTWPRKRGDSTVKVSELGDVIRAFDPSYNWQNQVTLALRFLMEQSQRGATGKFRFGWKAFDMDHFNANGGPNLAAGSEERKELFKKCLIRGQKNFQSDGTVIGPSGKVLKAKLYLLQAYPAKG